MKSNSILSIRTDTLIVVLVASSQSISMSVCMKKRKEGYIILEQHNSVYVCVCAWTTNMF
jgi:hypothetical protein